MDMSNWLIAWINGGKYKGRQVLPPGFVIDASTPQMNASGRPAPGTPPYPDLLFNDMGYGWAMNAYRGHYRVQHSGDLPLFSANVCFFPTDSIGIVVLVNKYNAFISQIISSYISDRLFSLPYKNWESLLLGLQQKKDQQSARQREPVPVPKPLSRTPRDYAGTYYDPGYGTILVMLSGHTLTASHNGQPIHFEHDTGDTFFADVPNGKLVFLTDKQGRIGAISATVEAGIDDIVFKKINN